MTSRGNADSELIFEIQTFWYQYRRIFVIDEIEKKKSEHCGIQGY